MLAKRSTDCGTPSTPASSTLTWNPL